MDEKDAYDKAQDELDGVEPEDANEPEVWEGDDGEGEALSPEVVEENFIRATFVEGELFVAGADLAHLLRQAVFVADDLEVLKYDLDFLADQLVAEEPT